MAEELRLGGVRLIPVMFRRRRDLSPAARYHKARKVTHVLGGDDGTHSLRLCGKDNIYVKLAWVGRRPRLISCFGPKLCRANHDVRVERKINQRVMEGVQ